MGYSKNPKTLTDFYEYVKDLEKGEDYMWYLDSTAVHGDAEKLAYKIRNCLYLANLYPEKFPALHAVAELFSIEIVDNNRVQARRANRITEVAISGGRVSPQHGGTQPTAGKALGTAGPQTEFSVIETWQQFAKFGNSNTPLHFPDAGLEYPQLLNLWKWAHSLKLPLMIMVDDKALTIGPIEDQIVEFSWKPNPEDAPEPEQPKSYPVPPRPY